MSEGGTSVDRWLAAAEADADRRGLPDLKTLLRGHAATMRVLRAADWNDRADPVAPPATPGSEPRR